MRICLIDCIMASLVSCLYPKVVRNRYTHELMCVPCGRCSSCICRKSSLWVARLREESVCHTYTLFGTLTYDDSSLPRIDIASLDEKYLTDKFVESYENSLDFCNFHNNLIPTVDSSDIQKFIKRLRAKITYYHGTQTSFRYYVVSEYGPTTFRPHYHLLLWFDSDNLAKNIKKYIYSAWKSQAGNPSCSDFFRRNKWKYVHGRVEEYVAGYLNMSANLPPVLYQKPFRTWHVQSIAPPIGTIRVLKDTLSKILSGDVSKVSLGRPSSSKLVSVSLWRGIENRYFPKCLGFSRISPRDRITLYKASCASGQDISFELFEKRVHDEWFSSSNLSRLLHDVIPSSAETGCLLLKEFRRSLKRIHSISRRVSEMAVSLGITLEDYVSRIEKYYNRKEYNSLLSQLEFQQKLADSPRHDNDLRYYPQIIDPFFTDNSRLLENYDVIALSFGIIDPLTIYDYLPKNSLEWKNKASFTSKIVFDNTKTRVNKSYLSSHPESFLRYRSFLTPFKLKFN